MPEAAVLERRFSVLLSHAQPLFRDVRTANGLSAQQTGRPSNLVMQTMIECAALP